MNDNCDMNLFDPENMEIKPGKIDLFIPVGSKMTVSASVDSVYCIGLKTSDRDVNLKMSREQVVKLARGILSLSGEEKPQSEWLEINHRLNLLIGVLYSNQCISNNDIKYIEDSIKKLMKRGKANQLRDCENCVSCDHFGDCGGCKKDEED